MDIILPKKNTPPARPRVLGLLLAFSLGMAAAVFAMKPPASGARVPAQAQAASSASVPVEDATDREYHASIARLEEEIDRYYDAMALAEELGDRQSYLDIVAAAAQKNLEADTLWFEWQDYRKKKGLMAEGVKQAVTGAPPLRGFGDAEKLKMLSEKHGLSEDALRAVKAEIEILFYEELYEKFSAHDHSAHE